MFCYRCKYKYIFANPRFLQENIFVWGQESRCGRCFGVFALLPILFTMSFPPPRGNPGWLYAWYCVALLPRRCPSPPPPPRVPHQVRDDGAMRRCTIAPLCTAAFFLLCHSRLRAGILGGFMRGIALHYCLAGVHPRQRLPGSRIKCGMTAHCAVVPSRSLCTAARTPTVSFWA